MLQHGLIEGQLDVQNLFEGHLAVPLDAVGALEGERAGTTDVVQLAGQIEGTGIPAPFATDGEGIGMRQVSLGQQGVLCFGQRPDVLLHFGRDIGGAENGGPRFVTVEGDRQVRPLLAGHL